MRGVYIAAIAMTIFMIWILLLSYKYAYKRKWGNEESSVDALPDTETDGPQREDSGDNPKV